MKTIYTPKGKAGEYAKFAVNFYNGCSNDCEYCYLKRGVLSKTLGGSIPTLQKKYKSEEIAFDMFLDDIDTNYYELKKSGIFFTFSSDPFLKETCELNWFAAITAANKNIPVMLLTKRADFVDMILKSRGIITAWGWDNIAFGFTLTGHDELEASANTNDERISAMETLYGAGFKTWASIEPIIEPSASLAMMRKVQPFCNHFKVGLRSGVAREYYDDKDLHAMFMSMEKLIYRPIYLKNSFVTRLGLDHTKFGKPFVNSDFDIFKNK